MTEPQVSSNAAGPAPVSLFYSYAHEDERLRDELQGHLKILERKGLLAPWHDRKIVAGAQWSGDIDAHLRSAELILLLVSADFIASDYIFGVELAEAMKRQLRKEATVVPIMVRAVDLDPEDAEDLPFLKLQGLPTDLRPVTSWANRDEAWVDVAKGLRSTVKLIRESRAAAPVSRGVPAAPSMNELRLDEDDADGAGAGAGADDDDADDAGAFAAPAAAPAGDAVLQGVVDGVVSRVQQALVARGEPPLSQGGIGALRQDALSLIDLPDAQRVLWVDDRPENNVNEVGALSRLQIEVVPVRSTEEALRRIADDAEGFDLVISDWTRPAEPADAGLALVERLRTAGHDQPVLIYHAATGRQRAERAAQAKRAGVFGEAVLPGELMALVRDALKAA